MKVFNKEWVRRAEAMVHHLPASKYSPQLWYVECPDCTLFDHDVYDVWQDDINPLTRALHHIVCGGCLHDKKQVV